MGSEPRSVPWDATPRAAGLFALACVALCRSMLYILLALRAPWPRQKCQAARPELISGQSLRRHAAVDIQNLAGDAGRRVRDHEADHVGDLVGGGAALQRDAFERRGIVQDVAAILARLDRALAGRIDPSGRD